MAQVCVFVRSAGGALSIMPPAIPKALHSGATLLEPNQCRMYKVT